MSGELNVIALQSASASVAWTKTLTLAISFKPEVIELSYCICVFLVTRPFTWYHNFWPCDLDLEVWPTFKNFNLGNNFQTRSDRAVYSLWQDLSHGTIIFDLVTLTLTFDLLLKNFNLGHNFQTRSVRTFILHICIPCDRTFHMEPLFLTLWRWPWNLAYVWKNFNLGCYFMMVAASVVVFWQLLLCIYPGEGKGGGVN